MKTKVHLISMPWATPVFPSIQTGVLKSYIDSVFKDKIVTNTYSGHLQIMFDIAQSKLFSFYEDFNNEGELLYYFVYAQTFLKGQGPSVNSDLKKFNIMLKKMGRRTVSQTLLNRIAKATRDYLDRVVIPEIQVDACNVVGFSMNYNQVYPSLYAAKYLREKCKNTNLQFLYGGSSAAFPHTLKLLEKLELPGYCVVGEGEKKLESFLGNLLELGNSENFTPPNGFFCTRDADSLYEIPKEVYENQILNITQLPIPDYDEYFSLLPNMINEVESIKDSSFSMLFEGTRGCFAKCDFCGLNFLWKGFRKVPSEIILEKIERLVEKYGINNVQFVDNVCDTWAEDFAERLIAERRQLASMMELRAHHPEAYWTKLALSGVSEIQVGVEALAPNLLRQMNKGTHVIQNLRCQKYLKELGITSVSNLIIDHPKSTLEDVAETKRIVEQIPHWGQFNTSKFVLSSGSPMYNLLTLDQKKALKPIRYAFLSPKAKALQAFAAFEWPKDAPISIGPGVINAWGSFKMWYGELEKKNSSGTLIAKKSASGRFLILDTRWGQSNTYWLNQEQSYFLDLCQRGLNFETLRLESCYSKEVCEKILSEVIEFKIVLFADDHYLSLNIRDKAELIQNYLNLKFDDGSQSEKLAS